VVKSIECAALLLNAVIDFFIYFSTCKYSLSLKSLKMKKKTCLNVSLIECVRHSSDVMS